MVNIYNNPAFVQDMTTAIGICDSRCDFCDF